MGSRNQTVKKDQFFPTKIIFLIQDKELEIFPPVSTKKNIPIYMKALENMSLLLISTFLPAEAYHYYPTI